MYKDNHSCLNAVSYLCLCLLCSQHLFCVCSKWTWRSMGYAKGMHLGSVCATLQ